MEDNKDWNTRSSWWSSSSQQHNDWSSSSDWKNNWSDWKNDWGSSGAAGWNNDRNDWRNNDWNDDGGDGAEAEGDAQSSSTDANRNKSGARHVPSDGAGGKPAEDVVIVAEKSSLRGRSPPGAAGLKKSSALPAGSGPTGTGGAIGGWSEFILALADLTQRYSEEHAASIAKLHGEDAKKSIKFVTKADYNQHMRKLSKLLELNLEAQLAETTDWIRREVLDEETKALKDQRYFPIFSYT